MVLHVPMQKAYIPAAIIASSSLNLMENISEDFSHGRNVNPYYGSGVITSFEKFAYFFLYNIITSLR